MNDLRQRLVDILMADLPANVAAMRLLIEAESADAALRVVESMRSDPALAGPERERLDAIGAVLARHPEAWTRIRLVMAQADHKVGAGPEHWAAVFDRLATVAPDESVALYALGSGELARSTADEVVAMLAGWHLIGPQTAVLDLGCGVGRLSVAVAPHVAGVLGLDVSSRMVAEARRRGAGIDTVRFRQTSGRDLGGVPDAGVDLVLAADVFPYLVTSGSGLADAHIGEAARVLRPGGSLVILNYSYRGDDALDRADVRASFAAHGFAPEQAGVRVLQSWDAPAFVGRKL